MNLQLNVSTLCIVPECCLVNVTMFRVGLIYTPSVISLLREIVMDWAMSKNGPTVNHLTPSGPGPIRGSLNAVYMVHYIVGNVFLSSPFVMGRKGFSFLLLRNIHIDKYQTLFLIFLFLSLYEINIIIIC